ncbi:MAG: SgcJ/EcaC family oxidoreductase [Pirellulales bacterium]
MRLRNAFVGGAFLISWALLLAARASAQGTDHAEDRQAIEAAAKGYVAALDRGDTKQLASFWMPDGDFIDEHGNVRPASELLAEAAQSAGQGERPQVKLVENRVRFVTDDVAIEDGTSEVARPGAELSRGRFSAVWVKRDGTWRLTSLREAPLHVERRPAKLADLAWLLGDWSGKSGDTTMEMSVQWNATETFLLRDLKVVRGGDVLFRVSQRIGWDPVRQQIKSWIFDSDGGYGEAFWTREGDDWVIRASNVLPDGQQVTAIGSVRRDGPDRFTWKSSGTNAAGEPGQEARIEFSRRPSEK